ncbi:MAG: thiolase domain-containing protein [Thermoplasmata archaeon]
MKKNVAVVGIGHTAFRPRTDEYSWKELMYEAASRAYDDAGLNPRKEIDSFVTCAEDYWEGFSIFDEFVPDQIGAALRPCCTVSGDGIQGLALAYMQIASGQVDTVAVEAHSKISDLLTYNDVLAFALDPIYNRPLGGHPHYIAGMEMRRYLRDSKSTEKDCARVVVKNKTNALKNTASAYGTKLSTNDVMTSAQLFSPLKKLDISSLVDGGIVLVLANAKRAKEITDQPIWITGIGWNSDTPWLENRDWGRAEYAELASKMAYKMAGIKNPAKELEFAEVDDKFSYKELQHIEAAKLCRKGEAGKRMRNGDFDVGGKVPVNVSGGSLGCGNLLEASGLHRAMEVALQLRGHAGRHQLPKVRRGLAMSWRSIPTATGAAVVMEV